MITEFLDSLEDPNRPLLAPNYWLLKKGGFLLPKNWYAKVTYIFIHEFVAAFVLSQYMELYVIKSDLDEVITNIRISMQSVMCVIKANMFIIWQKKWKEVMEYVSEADKYERDTQDDIRGKILDSYKQYCRKITYFYWGLVFATFITLTHTPLVRFLSSSTFRAELKNGTELFPHICSSWVPFDKYSFPGNFLTVVVQAFSCAIGSISMAAYDTNLIVIMVFFGGKFELLRERCKIMLGRNGTGVTDRQALDNLRQLHHIHVTLTKHFRLFNSLVSPVMFLYVVMDSLMLCASAYQLTLTSNTAQKFVMAEYLIFGIAQLFVFCWHSNTAVIKSEELILGPYEGDWWAASLPQRKATVLFVGQLQIPHIFTAGPFTYLTVSTFLTIMKGAYSYFTLLRK